MWSPKVSFQLASLHFHLWDRHCLNPLSLIKGQLETSSVMLGRSLWLELALKEEQQTRDVSAMKLMLAC